MDTTIALKNRIKKMLFLDNLLLIFPPSASTFFVHLNICKPFLRGNSNCFFQTLCSRISSNLHKSCSIFKSTSYLFSRKQNRSCFIFQCIQNTIWFVKRLHLMQLLPTTLIFCIISKFFEKNLLQHVKIQVLNLNLLMDC